MFSMAYIQGKSQAEMNMWIADSLVFQVTIPNWGGNVLSKVVHFELLHTTPTKVIFSMFSEGLGLNCFMELSTWLLYCKECHFADTMTYVGHKSPKICFTFAWNRKWHNLFRSCRETVFMHKLCASETTTKGYFCCSEMLGKACLRQRSVFIQFVLSSFTLAIMNPIAQQGGSNVWLTSYLLRRCEASTNITGRTKLKLGGSQRLGRHAGPQYSKRLTTLCTQSLSLGWASSNFLRSMEQQAQCSWHWPSIVQWLTCGQHVWNNRVVNRTRSFYDITRRRTYFFCSQHSHNSVIEPSRTTFLLISSISVTTGTLHTIVIVLSLRKIMESIGLSPQKTDLRSALHMLTAAIDCKTYPSEIFGSGDNFLSKLLIDKLLKWPHQYNWSTPTHSSPPWFGRILCRSYTSHEHYRMHRWKHHWQCHSHGHSASSIGWSRLFMMVLGGLMCSLVG